MTCQPCTIKSLIKPVEIQGMSDFLDQITGLIEQAVLEHGIKKNPLLIKIGVDPAVMNQVMREKRAMPDSILKALGESEMINASYAQLWTWRAIDQYGEDVMREAAKIVLEMEE